MNTDRRPARYSLWGQALHWTFVALLIVQFTLARLAEALPKGLERAAMFDRHRSVGIAILAIVLVRLAWRFRTVLPPAPAMPRWQLLAARANHAAFYAILIALPVTGWLVTSTGGKEVVPFGWFTLPALMPPGEEMHHLLEEVHEVLSKVLIGLAILHVLAALKHHFIDRDGLLFRMLPWRPR